MGKKGHCFLLHWEDWDFSLNALKHVPCRWQNSPWSLCCVRCWSCLCTWAAVRRCWPLSPCCQCRMCSTGQRWGSSYSLGGFGVDASGVKSEHICQKKFMIWSEHLLVNYPSDVPFHLRACSCAVGSFFADGKVEGKSVPITPAFPSRHIQPKPSQSQLWSSDCLCIFRYTGSISSWHLCPVLLSFNSVSSRLCCGGVRFVLDPLLLLQSSLLTSALIYVAAVCDSCFMCRWEKWGEVCGSPGSNLLLQHISWVTEVISRAVRKPVSAVCAYASCSINEPFTSMCPFKNRNWNWANHFVLS